uniref:WD_REPEATS_REGION domain-containing protein n=1 Tax=Strongyloides papillosus TaxID=174720 RepID=A0A0N5B9I1_STREA
MGKYQKDKTFSCEVARAMVDVLVSRNRDILYVPSYPGILSEINLKDSETSDSYVDRDVVVYIPDNNNINVIKGCCFRDSNEDAIICSSMDGNVYGYDIVQSQLLFKINSHYCVNDVCMIAPNNCNVFISAGPKSLNIFDSRILRTRSDVGAPIAIIGYNSINYRYISSRGDGNYVVGTCYDNAIKVYDIRYANKNIFNVLNNNQFNDLRCIGEVPIKKCQYVDTVCKAKISPQHTGSRFIYTGCYNENVSIFDLYTGAKVKTIKCTESSQVSTLDWHPFKNQIVAGATCGKVVCISDEKDSELIMEGGKNPDNDHGVDHNSNNEIPNDNRRRLSKIRFLGQEYERHFPRLPRRQIDYSTIE